jgi:uncharacterized membrane protein
MLTVDVESLRLFLHVLAATIWVGGQLTLGALVPVLRKAGADVSRMAARQFGRIAWTAFAVLIATGIWNLASYDGKDRHGYTATITVKLVLVALSGIAAAVHGTTKSRAILGISGGLGALFALGALFFGIVLAQ